MGNTHIHSGKLLSAKLIPTSTHIFEKEHIQRGQTKTDLRNGVPRFYVHSSKRESCPHSLPCSYLVHLRSCYYSSNYTFLFFTPNSLLPCFVVRRPIGVHFGTVFDSVLDFLIGCLRTRILGQCNTEKAPTRNSRKSARVQNIALSNQMRRSVTYVWE